MRTLITGSLAYDTITVFPDKFAKHILPDHIHSLSISMLVEKPRNEFGGTAGNIAFSMQLLGGQSRVWATAGSDFERYQNWLSSQKIETSGIRILENEFTAHAYIITDLDHNQITAFHGGAMFRAEEHPIIESKSIDRIVISANAKDAMLAHTRFAQEKGISFWFDPGQAMSTFSSEELQEAAFGAELLILNEYEWAMFCEKTGIASTEEALKEVQRLIITHGSEGAELFSEEESFKIPAAKATKVVDPTGCGDAFRGGMLAALQQGKNWKEAMGMGAEIAARCVEVAGSQNHSTE